MIVCRMNFLLELSGSLNLVICWKRWVHLHYGNGTGNNAPLFCAFQNGKIMNKTKAGFTLIELLVVVLIIGILASIALPQYRMAVTKSRYASLKHLVQALYTAEEAYFMANGAYTDQLDELSLDMPGTANSASSTARYFDRSHNRYCTVVIGSSVNQYLYCKDGSSGISYGKKLVGNKKYFCVPYSDSSYYQTAKKICKSETNDTLDENGAWYAYP